MAVTVEAGLSAFGKGKLQLNNQEVEDLRQNTLYARLAIVDGVQTVEKRPTWPTDWKLPAAGTSAEKTKAFVAEYGTHYIQKLYYGRTIEIKATVRESEEKQKKDVTAKLRAKLLTFSLTAKFAQDAKEETKNSQFDLLMTVQGGKSDRPERQLIRSFDELETFIKDLQAGQYKIVSAPIAAEVLSLSGLTGDEGVNAALRGEVRFTDPSIVGNPIKMEAYKSHTATSDGVISATTGGSKVNFSEVRISYTPPGGRTITLRTNSPDLTPVFGSCTAIIPSGSTWEVNTSPFKVNHFRWFFRSASNLAVET